MAFLLLPPPHFSLSSFNVVFSGFSQRTEPNLELDKNIYPVIVWFHSGDFARGTSQQQPGHVLAIRDVVVVTFNYRLGAFGEIPSLYSLRGVHCQNTRILFTGFLTTEDEHAQGNWGMFDQVQALEFIKENIRAFRGDPNSITIMGDGAGAVSVGMHLISPVSSGKGEFEPVAFKKCIMSMVELVHYKLHNSLYRSLPPCHPDEWN